MNFRLQSINHKPRTYWKVVKVSLKINRQRYRSRLVIRTGQNYNMKTYNRFFENVEINRGLNTHRIKKPVHKQWQQTNNTVHRSSTVGQLYYDVHHCRVMPYQSTEYCLLCITTGQTFPLTGCSNYPKILTFTFRGVFLQCRINSMCTTTCNSIWPGKSRAQKHMHKEYNMAHHKIRAARRMRVETALIMC